MGGRVPGAHRITAHADIWRAEGQNKNTPDLVAAVSAHATRSLTTRLSSNTNAHSYKTPDTQSWTNLPSLYSEPPDYSAPLRSSDRETGHWPQTAVGETRDRLMASQNFKCSHSQQRTDQYIILVVVLFHRTDEGWGKNTKQTQQT